MVSQNYPEVLTSARGCYLGSCRLISLSKVNASTHTNRIHICLLGQIKLIIVIGLLVSKRNCFKFRDHSGLVANLENSLQLAIMV